MNAIVFIYLETKMTIEPISISIDKFLFFFKLLKTSQNHLHAMLVFLAYITVIDVNKIKAKQVNIELDLY